VDVTPRSQAFMDPRSDSERKAVTIQAQLESILNPVEGVRFHPNDVVSLLRPPGKGSSSHAGLPPRAPMLGSAPTVPLNTEASQFHVPIGNQHPHVHCRQRRWRKKEQNLDDQTASVAPKATASTAKHRSFKPAGFHMRANAESNQDRDTSVAEDVSAKEKAMFEQLIQQRKQWHYPSLGELLHQPDQQQPPPLKERGKKGKDMEPQIPWPSKSESRKDDLFARYQASLLVQPAITTEKVEDSVNSNVELEAATSEKN